MRPGGTSGGPAAAGKTLGPVAVTRVFLALAAASLGIAAASQWIQARCAASQKAA